jgi:hypothetical protein
MKVRFSALFTVIVGCASSAPSVERAAPVEKAVARTPIQEAWDEVFLARTIEPYTRVTALYETHLVANPDDREARNRYGKLLYAQGRWRAAATEFESVANGQNDHFGKAAARNALLAWRRVLDQGDAVEGHFRPFSEDEDVDKAALGFMWDQIGFDTLATGRYEEKVIPAVEQRIADAADRYVAISEPTEDALPLIQLISANSYFRHYHFADAADRCLRVTEHWPRHDMALTCGNVILNMFSATEDLGQLEKYARQLWQNRALMARHTDLKNGVEETLHFVGFQNAWNMVEKANRKKGAEKKKILLAAAERFRQYQDEFPESPHADKALFNALAQYVTFGVKDNARSVAEEIVEDYPRSPVASQARQVLAQLSR